MVTSAAIGEIAFSNAVKKPNVWVYVLRLPSIPNFDGLSRGNYEVFLDIKLSRILNHVPILSHSELNVMSHVAVDHFDGLISIPNSLSSYAFIRGQNAQNPFLVGAPPRTLLGKLTTLPKIS